MADILNILEKIQVIGINVEDQADLREETQKAIGIFTGLRQEGLRVSYPNIPPDGGQNPPYGNGGVAVSGQENVGSQGGFAIDEAGNIK